MSTNRDIPSIDLSPEALREMRDSEGRLDRYSDDELLIIGEDMLFNDHVWEALHSALDTAVSWRRADEVIN